MSITRNEFREEFLTPLEVEFGIKMYFSGKESMNAKCDRIRTGERAYSCVDREEAPIVLSFQKDKNDLLLSVVHELVHSLLHKKGTELYERDDITKEEIEAETVTFEVAKIFNMLSTCKLYIEEYQRKHMYRYGEEYIIPKHIHSELNSIVYRIWSVLVDKDLSLLKSENVTYDLQCKKCNTTFKYQNKCKTYKYYDRYKCSCGGKLKQII